MYRAHWDSKKEYEKFWAGSKTLPTAETKKKKPKKRGRWIALLVLAVICIGAAIKVSPEHRVHISEVTSSRSIVDAHPDDIPEFSGEDYIILNNNVPNFTVADLDLAPCEHYSELDNLGRCGTAFAVLDRSMMPTEEREEIGQIKPSGWHQNRYEGIINSNPPYLYNRCHLIAYALSGENANEKNLITGTRYFNETSMLSFELQVMKYLDTSDNHVLYRVSPLFIDDELVARGVEIEALSVEDNGKGICLHVFVYNYQPEIHIDYLTGENYVCNR